MTGIDLLKGNIEYFFKKESKLKAFLTSISRCHSYIMTQSAKPGKTPMGFMAISLSETHFAHRN